MPVNYINIMIAIPAHSMGSCSNGANGSVTERATWQR